MNNRTFCIAAFSACCCMALLLSCGGGGGGGGNSPSQGQWSRTFGGSVQDSGSSVVQTTDGGYILLGDTNSYGHGGFDAYLVKTDSQGVMVWSTAIGGSNDEFTADIQKTADGGYVFVGITGSLHGVGMTDMYLVKTDATGTVEWSKTYGGADSDLGASVQQTTDNGYILFGTGNRPGDMTSSDMYLVKTDPSGTVEWSKTYGAANWLNEGSSVQQTPDGGYILLGSTKSDTTDSMGVNRGAMNLIKTDPTGSVVWSKKYGSPEEGAVAHAMQQASDGGYILCGETHTGVYDYIGIYLEPISKLIFSCHLRRTRYYLSWPYV